MTVWSRTAKLGLSTALAAGTVLGAFVGYAHGSTLPSVPTGGPRPATVANPTTERGWLEPSGVYVAANTTSPVSDSPQTLYRIDPDTQQVQAELRLAGTVGDVVESDGHLVVTTTVGAGTHSPQTFVRAVDPVSLASLHLQPLPASPSVQQATLQEAVAGGSVWVADGPDLVAVDPSSGTIKTTIAASTASGKKAPFVAVAAGPLHQTLVDSIYPVSYDPAVQRRDPMTGALQAQSPGIPATIIGDLAVIDSGILVSVPTGTDGYLVRLSLATMRPGATTGQGSLHSITAHAFGDILYVTNDTSASAANYRADPMTGAVRAALPALNGSTLIGGTPSRYYYLTSGADTRIASAPVPASCH